MTVYGLLVLAWELMPWFMGAWLALGLVMLVRDRVWLHQDVSRLSAVRAIVYEVPEPDHAEKLRLRGALVTWAGSNSSPIARWLTILNNAVLVGGQVDASSFVDGIWAVEIRRHSAFTFLARFAILVGLLFTSAGLCKTLADVAPTLVQHAATPEEWVRRVQEAMSQALGGMSTAFHSSLAGIGISLLLFTLGYLLYLRKHDRYMADLEAFVQGGLIPVYSSIVEQDRSDVVREVLERVEESFGDVRQQYESILKKQTEQLEQLAKYRSDLVLAGQGLAGAIESFTGGITLLKGVGGEMQQAAKAISVVMGAGVKKLVDTHREQEEELRRFQLDVIKPFADELTGQFREQREANDRLAFNLSQVAKDFSVLSTTIAEQLAAVASVTAGPELQRQLKRIYEMHGEEVGDLYEKLGQDLQRAMESLVAEAAAALPEQLAAGLGTAIEGTHERVTRFGEALDRLAANHDRTAQTLDTLGKAFAFNEEGLAKDIAARKAALEDMLSRSVDILSRGFEERGDALVADLGSRIDSTLKSGLERQEGLVRDFSDFMAKKWADLLTASAAKTLQNSRATVDSAG